MFTQILTGFHIKDYKIILESLVGCSFLFVFGVLFGFISAKLLKFNKKETNFICATFSSPHTTSLAVILLQLLGPYLDAIYVPKPGEPNAVKRGFSYIVINTIFATMWRWSGAYYLLESDEGVSEKVEVQIGLDEIDEKGKFKGHDVDEVNTAVTHHEEEPFFKQLLNAPLITCVVCILITLFPSVQDLFTKPGEILNATLVSVNMMVSRSYSFLAMIMVGCTPFTWPRFKSENEDATPFLDYVWISMMKLIAMPLIACPILYCIFKLWLQSDPVMLFIYMFMACAPVAINNIVICNYKNASIDACSSLLITMYALSVITVGANVSACVYFLGY